ncbi:FHA domain-containing protein [Nocardioides sp. WV_118_6]
MSTAYVPGELATLVTGDAIVLAPADRLADLVALAGPGLSPAPAAWTAALGGLPELAAVVREGDVLRLLARGGYAVRAGGLSVDGRAGAPGTTTETSTPLTAGVVVELGPLGVALTGTGPGPALLPIGAGVVRSGGVRWCPLGDPAPAPAAPAAPEHTVVRGAAPVAPAIPVDPDHDGRTITPAQLQALRATPSAAVPAAPPPPLPPPPPVRPLVALRLSTGRVVPVRRRVLVGRSPRVQQVGGSANLPALVTVDDPYVSGTHLEVSSDGTRVTATDTSTNGTLLTRPGQIPVPLDHGVPTEVAMGDVLTLSKGVTATVVPAHEAEG